MMLCEKKWSRISLIVFGIILILGVAYRITSSESSIRGTPPWSMDRNRSEEEQITQIRSHLQKLSDTGKGDIDVLGYVILNRVINFEEFVSLSNNYSLSAEQGASLIMRVKGGGIGGIPLMQEITTSDKFRSFIMENEPETSGSGQYYVGVVGIYMYAPTATFLRLWNENIDVRAIGVMGAKGEQFMKWHPVDIGEPIVR